jgi:tRNA (mo5U34)-methyltransferase
MTSDEARELVGTIAHWHHKFEVYPGVITPGSYDPTFMWNKLGLADACEGKRALDVGPSDGFFSKRLAERGAEVTALDYRPKDGHGFGVMERLSGLTFEYIVGNILDLNVDQFGTFDIVLFLGVLYHLPDPMRGLHAVRQVSSDAMFLETWYEPDLFPDVPVARYWRANSANNDPTNFWSPNRLCVLDMLHDAGFDVVREEAWGRRLLVETRIATDPARLLKMRTAYGTMERT